MKRIYLPYWDWEDYRNGFYKTSSIDINENDIILFMSNTEEFGKSMTDVVNLWKNSMLHNLTNPHINRIAYIGQCAVCFKFGCPNTITKKLWKLLSNETKNKANVVAKNILNVWLNEHKD